MAQVKNQITLSELVVKPLEPATWPAFAQLVEDNNGVWGGCWCLGFHIQNKTLKSLNWAQRRAEKEQRVLEDRTHAALVFDGDQCLG